MKASELQGYHCGSVSALQAAPGGGAGPAPGGAGQLAWCLAASRAVIPAASADDDKHGKLVYNDREFPLSVLALPCVTETYKTFDDTNYVKVTDIGQVGLDRAAGAAQNW